MVLGLSGTNNSVVAIIVYFLPAVIKDMLLFIMFLPLWDLCGLPRLQKHCSDPMEVK